MSFDFSYFAEPPIAEKPIRRFIWSIQVNSSMYHVVAKVHWKISRIQIVVNGETRVDATYYGQGFTKFWLRLGGTACFLRDCGPDGFDIVVDGQSCLDTLKRERQAVCKRHRRGLATMAELELGHLRFRQDAPKEI